MMMASEIGTTHLSAAPIEIDNSAMSAPSASIITNTPASTKKPRK